jgi:hypothetical protein
MWRQKILLTHLCQNRSQAILPQRKQQQRLIALFITEMNGKNIIKAINTFAIPVLMYLYGIIKRSNTSGKFTKENKNHPN